METKPKIKSTLEEIKEIKVLLNDFEELLTTYCENMGDKLDKAIKTVDEILEN